MKNTKKIENANTEIINAEIEKAEKKKEQNKRIWLSCDKKGHFGCMVPARYLARPGVKEKLVCPICGEPLKSKEDHDAEIEMAANN